MILSHIVAAAQNDVIGAQGALPWDIPEDLRFFKEKTRGRALIMGRKTFESIGKALPGRLNVVITGQKNFTAPGVVTAPDLKAAVALCEKEAHRYGDEIFIIGGGEIYKQSLPLVDRIYLTRIHQNFEGDTKYPAIDMTMYKITREERRDSPVPFTFYTLERS